VTPLPKMRDTTGTGRNSLRPLVQIRGYLAVAFVGCSLLVGDVLERTVVVAAARLFPGARSRILSRWLQTLRATVLDVGSMAIGGAEVEPTPRLPARPGVLVIMNHQSLLDIPLIIRTMKPDYPRIVTRRRFRRGIPLISHITRLYQYPEVDPRATVKRHLDGLRDAAENGETPLVIFPEGTRSRMGELGRWKRTGLRVILAARSWEVYVVVVDGLWQSGRLADFVKNISRTRARMTYVGPFASPPPGEDVEPFIDDMQVRMAQALAELRSAPT